MDWIALAFYALICATLGAASPWLPSLPTRLAVGAVVGIAAASVLPLLRQTMTGY